MSELRANAANDRLPLAHSWDRRRWSICLVLALLLHGAGAAAALTYWRVEADQVVGAPLVLIELAVAPAAPELTPTDLPPAPEQAQAAPAAPSHAVAAPKPAAEPDDASEAAALPTAPEAENSVAAAPPQATEPARQHERPHSQPRISSAPSAAARRADHAAAPATGAPAHDHDALPSWKSALVNRLERYKRYPAEAGGEHGVAQLAFSVDRAGGVHHARILRSSGSGVLDRATLALIERAQPLPPPPPDIRGTQIAVVVPIRYNIR
jgi:protein TonB